MSPILISGLLVSGAFWGLVELVYWFDHRPRVRDGYRDLCEQLGVPDVSWLNTLMEIRGLQDTRGRNLVYDWGVDRWVED